MQNKKIRKNVFCFIFLKIKNVMFSNNIFLLFFIVFTYFFIVVLKNNYTNI